MYEISLLVIFVAGFATGFISGYIQRGDWINKEVERETNRLRWDLAEKQHKITELEAGLKCVDS